VSFPDVYLVSYPYDAPDKFDVVITPVSISKLAAIKLHDSFPSHPLSAACKTSGRSSTLISVGGSDWDVIYESIPELVIESFKVVHKSGDDIFKPDKAPAHASKLTSGSMSPGTGTGCAITLA
jgi:hypothetical protein